MSVRVEGWLCDSCGLENDATDFPCKGCRYPLVPPAAFHARSEEDGGTEEEQGNVFDGILGDSSVPQEAQNAARARRKVDVCHGSSAGSSEADGGSESVSASPEGMLYEGHARRTHRRRHHPPPLEHELRALPLDLQHAMAAPGDEHEWQCDMCLLASEGPPCICCGYDPAEVEGVPPDLSAVPPAAAEAAELAESTYPDHLRAAASMLAVHEDEEEAAVAARRLATELTAAAKIVAAPEGSDVGPVAVRGGGFRFRVWAPHALKVELAGDFNEWKTGGVDSQMLPEADEEHWRLVVPKAKFGHKYRFRVHFQRDTSKMRPLTPTSKDPERSTKRESIQIRRAWRADPYAAVLELDETNRNIYNSVLYDHSVFPWDDADFRRPPDNQLVLYEIHVATFATHTENCCGTFLSTSERLDYLCELGVNGLCLMPVTLDAHPNAKEEFSCWGYDPMSFFAVHNFYGTPDDLKMLVNEAHRRGMIVIFDFVANHMSSRNVLQWWDGTNLYFADEGTEWGPRPRFDHPRVRSYIIDAVLSYFRDYHFDGIRMDSTSNVRGIGHDIPGGWKLLQEINDAVHDRFPNAITIAEDLYDDDRLTSGGACFDMQWGQGYFKALFQMATSPTDKDRNVQAVCERMMHVHPGPIGGRVIYTENHDTVPGDRERRMPLAITHGLSDVNPQDNFYALKRSTLAACVMLCSPGMPMLLQGQEFLELSSPEWPEGFDLDWTNRIRMDGMFRLYQDMIRIRKNADGNTLGLTSPRLRTYHINAPGAVFAFHRFDKGGEGDDVVVLVNASNINFRSYRIGFPREGHWSVRLNTHDHAYHELYATTGVPVAPMVTASNFEPRDGYPFSAPVAIPKYTVLVMSQSGLSHLIFRVRMDTIWGDVVCVCGSGEAMGEWTEPRTLYTDAADVQYPWWQSKPITVLATTPITFKIVLRKGDGSLVWEERANRTLVPERGRHVVLLTPEM